MKKSILHNNFQRNIVLIIFLALFLLSYQIFDIEFVNRLLEKTGENIDSSSYQAALLIIFLRTISIVIPILPGTYCAVLAGYIYGIENGLMLMLITDFLSCSSSFLIARKLGRSFVSNLLGQKQMAKIEKISNKYLENNFFLMTGFLMTSWFDFVCYAVGLTKIKWRKFMPALILSIVISDLPFIAGGHAIGKLQNISFKDIINGEVDIIDGPYLLILIVSVLIIFGLGFINILLKRKTKSI